MLNRNTKTLVAVEIKMSLQIIRSFSRTPGSSGKPSNVSSESCTQVIHLKKWIKLRFLVLFMKPTLEFFFLRSVKDLVLTHWEQALHIFFVAWMSVSFDKLWMRP